MSSTAPPTSGSSARTFSSSRSRMCTSRSTWGSASAASSSPSRASSGSATTRRSGRGCVWPPSTRGSRRSEEHTSELQSLAYLVCRLLLEKKKTTSHGTNNEIHHTFHSTDVTYTYHNAN